MAKKFKKSKRTKQSRKTVLTDLDWGKIHAKAWRESKFRELLETDPTAAIKCYALEVGKTFDKIVIVRPRPAGIDDEDLEVVNPFPPSCC